MHWTTEKILHLAPNHNTAERAETLADTSKWLSLVTNGQIVWGECKGSKAAVYETAIDTEGPAFSCNCPSRLFPCKHGLALLLLAASDTDRFRVTDDIPEKIQNWLEKRKRSTPKTNTTPEAAQKQQAAKDKRFQARLQLMAQGVEDLELWLHDLIRVGLAVVDDSRPTLVSSQMQSIIEPNTEVWENMAKRMVDAKLPNIGRKIREIALIPTADADWGKQVLTELAEIHLFIQGFHRMEELPQTLQKELLRRAGVSTKKSEVLAQKGIVDKWMVIGQVETTNVDHAKVRRTWFLGQESGQYAQIIEYDYATGFEFHWPKGSIFQGEMVLYPSLLPLRGLLKSYEICGQIEDVWDGYTDIAHFLSDYANYLDQQPWLRDFPLAFKQVTPRLKKDSLYLVDEKGKGIPVLPSDLSNWKIMALSGGQPIATFGEWTGKVYNPLAVMTAGRYVSL